MCNVQPLDSLDTVCHAVPRCATHCAKLTCATLYCIVLHSTMLGHISVTLWSQSCQVRLIG